MSGAADVDSAIGLSESGMVEKVGVGRCWNRVAIYFCLNVISTSGLVAAILSFECAGNLCNSICSCNTSRDILYLRRFQSISGFPAAILDFWKVAKMA